MTQPLPLHSGEFTFGPRFELRRLLGEGGFGTVYQAFDREYNCIIALKHLRRVTADALYLFKQEFRSLNDLSHPNLVSLYELISDPSGNWLLVMEYIDGVDFLTYHAFGPGSGTAGARSAGGGSLQSSVTHSPTLRAGQSMDSLATLAGNPSATARELNLSAGSIATDQTMAPTVRPFLTVAAPDDEAAIPQQSVDPMPRQPLIRVKHVSSYAVLRDCLRQLAEGLCALHAAGKLHRDIKPSNILITRDSRVVLLDFGLVVDAPAAPNPTVPTGLAHAAPQIAGTPVYMAPEQFGGTIGPAADWYSVGVLLYEVLTGQLPFSGDLENLARSKQEREPEPPSSLRPDIPADLDSLCVQLLRRDPRQRPADEQVQRWLAGKVATSSLPTTRLESTRLLERESHLSALEESFGMARQGQTAVVLIQGRSGMGKSTLAQAYLGRLAARPESTVIIAGRCYEQESVPYKALDGVVDALCQRLCTLPDERVAALLPEGASALTQLFPVLRQVRLLRGQPEPQATDGPREEIRNLAFVTLRTLLIRLAATQPVVLMIDDMQWGDRDSAALLLELIRAPSPPRLLVLLCLRSDEANTSPALRFLLPRLQAAANDTLSVRRLEVTALSDGAARQLANELLGGDVTVWPAQAPTHEAGRSPFFITEMVRYLRDTAQTPQVWEHPDGPTTADDLLWRRIERLRPAARRALECLALLGRPAQRQLLSLAAELGSDELSVQHELRTSHLLRIRRSESSTLVEPYHDRIRETVVRRLAGEQRHARHLSLAIAIEQTGHGDAEDLARHFHGAERYEKARLYIRAAARQATAALAFGRAAELWRTALDWGAEADAGMLYEELGYANVAIGQGRAAADAYLRAAELSAHDRATELRLRAADQLLRSGFLDAGLSVLSADLRHIGIRLPADPRISMVVGVLRRALVDLRGLKSTIRREAECRASDLRRLDTLNSVAVGFSISSVARLADLQSRHILLALQVGEPFRLARALLLDAAYGATRGVKGHARNQRYIERALELAHLTDEPLLEVYKYLSPGVVAYLEGRFQAACDFMRNAELRLRGLSGVAWESEVATRYLLLSGLMLGELQPLLERSEALLRDAQRRDDAYAEASLRPTVLYMAELLRDDPAAALAHAAAAQARWVYRGFSGQHYWAESARLDAFLYSERWSDADAHLRAPWMQDTRRYLLPFHQYARITTLHRCGRVGLAAASILSPLSARRLKVLAEVERYCAQLEREQASWATALAWHLRGPLLALRGEQTAALHWMERAHRLCSELGLRLHAYSLDYRAGQLLGGKQGAARCEGARLALAERGARAPEKLVAMLLPLRV